MDRPLCSRCEIRAATIRFEVSGKAARPLCGACFRAVLRENHAEMRIDLARFFTLLARPRRIEDTPSWPALEEDARCPRCGLLYADFAAHGWVGCPACYTAFEAAILPALRALHHAGGDMS